MNDLCYIKSFIINKTERDHLEVIKYKRFSGADERTDITLENLKRLENYSEVDAGVKIFNYSFMVCFLFIRFKTLFEPL